MHSLRTSFFAILSGTGCMHSNRREGSKYVHCLHECNSKPHFGHCPSGSESALSNVPHCEQRETECVPGIWTGRGPYVSSLRPGDWGENDFWGFSPLSWYPCWRYLRSDKGSAPDFRRESERNILSLERPEHKGAGIVIR